MNRSRSSSLSLRARRPQTSQRGCGSLTAMLVLVPNVLDVLSLAHELRDAALGLHRLLPTVEPRKDLRHDRMLRLYCSFS